MTQPNSSAEIEIAIPSAPSTLADTVGPNMAQPSQLMFESFWEHVENGANGEKMIVQMRQDVMMISTPEKKTGFEAWLSSPQGTAIPKELFPMDTSASSSNDNRQALPNTETVPTSYGPLVKIRKQKVTAYVSPSKDQLKRENSELHDENEELKSTLDEMQTASKE